VNIACECGQVLFVIKFTPDGLAVTCPSCKVVAGLLVDIKAAVEA
jgi:phage FluMu protein Com